MMVGMTTSARHASSFTVFDGNQSFTRASHTARLSTSSTKSRSAVLRSSGHPVGLYRLTQRLPRKSLCSLREGESVTPWGSNYHCAVSVFRRPIKKCFRVSSQSRKQNNDLKSIPHGRWFLAQARDRPVQHERISLDPRWRRGGATPAGRIARNTDSAAASFSRRAEVESMSLGCADKQVREY